MKRTFTLLTAIFLMTMVAQAFELALFNYNRSYTDGQSISTANASLTLGDDLKGWLVSATKISEDGYLNAFGQSVPVSYDGEMNEQFSVITVNGQNNPKDQAEAGKGSGINCSADRTTARLPRNGTYYIFSSKTGGKVKLGIVINANKAFYLVDATNATKSEDGQYLEVSLPESNLHNYVIKNSYGEEVILADDDDGKGGKVVSDKVTGTVEFDAEAGKTYYFFCTGSKLGCFGYSFASDGSGHEGSDGNIVSIIDSFTYTWNSDESLTHNNDGSITYYSSVWGGLAAWFKGETTPTDWSDYEKIVFEFAEPTPVYTNLIVAGSDSNVSAWGNVGITSLECLFEGHDMTHVEQVALQTSDATTLIISAIYLVKKNTTSLGDVNSDGSVDVADVMLIVNHIIGNTLPIFNEEAANINGDSRIDVADVMLVVNMILNSSKAPEKDVLPISDMRAITDGNITLLQMDNTSEYTAFQMEVQMPEGVRLLNAELGDNASSHHLVTKSLGEGRYRIVAFSMNGKDLRNTADGILLRLISDGNAEGIRIGKILFANKACESLAFPDIAGTTGISDIAVEKSDGVFYNLQGMPVSKPSHGIYIKNGKKIVFK